MCVCGGGVQLHKDRRNKSEQNRPLGFACVCGGSAVPDLARLLIVKILLTVRSLAALTTG